MKCRIVVAMSNDPFETSPLPDHSLTFIGSNAGGAKITADGLYAHSTIGRVLELLALRYKTIFWHTRLCINDNEAQTYRLPQNIELIPGPFCSSSLDSLRKTHSITAAYEKAILMGDHIFIRGMLPAIRGFYRSCLRHGKRPLHWIVGNPISLLKSHRRDNWIMDNLGILYAKQWERAAKHGNQRSHGAFICNGRELYDRMVGCHRYEVVSSTISEDEFYRRKDTCLSDPIRITTVCFIRPEKGLQYLIEALAYLRNKRKILLDIVGSEDRSRGYMKLLNDLIHANHLENHVFFPGYMDQSGIFEQLKKSDIFVLPSLSEGTPRVIVESRSQGVPTIASNVGGIPSSLQDGLDGILVPPKNPPAIAAAIDRIIEDGEFRRRIIQGGYNAVKNFTLELFIDKVTNILRLINQK